MDKDDARALSLERSNSACAIVCDGLFVYANQKFLDTLGVEHFSDLEVTPILDLVDTSDQEKLKAHLNSAKFIGEHEEHAITHIPLKTAAGDRLSVAMNSHSLDYQGEECVRIAVEPAIEKTLAQKFVSLPWKFYLAALVLVFLFTAPGTLLLKLDINNAPDVYFPADAPAVIADNRLRETFPSDQVMVLLFEGVALYSDGFLTALHNLVYQLEGFELVSRVYSPTTQDHISGSTDEFFVDPLLGIDTLNETRPKSRLQRAVADRFANGTLVARDGSALAIVVIPTTEVTNSLVRLQLEDDILDAIKQARLSGYLTAIAGQVPLDVAQLRSMLRDNMSFNPITVAIGLSLVWWLYRRWLAVIVTGVTMGIITSSTVAVYVIANEPFTLISSIIPPLLLALTVAALIHLFNAIHYAAQRGLAGHSRMERALQEIRKPALFTALTTSAGLASLGTSPIVPISVFGLIASVGVLLIFVVVYFLLPVVIARFDYADWPSTDGGLKWMEHAVTGMFHLSIRRPAWILGGTLALMLGGIPAVLSVHAETNLLEFFRDGHPIKVDTLQIEEKLSGTTSLDVVLESESVDAFKRPELLKTIKQFQQWAVSQPEIDKTTSVADFIEEMHWGFNAENPAFRQIPDNHALITQYLLVYDGKDLYDFIDRDFKYTRIGLSVNVHHANEISAVMQRITEYWESQGEQALTFEIAGFGRLFADQEDLLVQGQVNSLFGALILIQILMIIQWRSLRDSLLCMIPNLSPVLLIFILMGVSGIWLDMGTAMIASVAVGIAVDDTIHIYHGFIHRVRRGINPVFAMARTYRQAGRAVMTTTLILGLQFFILVVSAFVPTSNFGLLTATGLVAALLFDVLLFPAILLLIFGRKNSRAKKATLPDQAA